MYYNKAEELLKRLELLDGSLKAGNNGVITEYINILHQLRDKGIISNDQLNKLLKSIYSWGTPYNPLPCLHRI